MAVDVLEVDTFIKEKHILHEIDITFMNATVKAVNSI